MFQKKVVEKMKAHLSLVTPPFRKTCCVWKCGKILYNWTSHR